MSRPNETLTNPHIALLRASLVACPFTILSVILFFPGFMEEDSVAQYEQARTGIYNDQFPPLLSIIWRYLDMVVQGQTGLLFFQTFLYWLALALLFSAYSRRRIYLPLIAAFGLFPPYFLTEGVIWKDVLMNNFFLLSIGLVAVAQATEATTVLSEDNLHNHRNLRRGFLLSASFGLLVVGVFFRYNAMLAIFPLVYLIVDEMEILPLVRPTLFRSDLIAIAVCVSIMVSLFGFYLTHRLAEKHFSTSQMIAAFDLIGIAATTDAGAFDPSEYPQLAKAFVHNAYADPAKLQQVYKPCDAFQFFTTIPGGDPIYMPSGEGEVVNQLWSAWAKAVSRAPRAYISHRVHVFLCSLGIGTMGPWYASTFFYVQPEAADLGIHWSGLSTLQNKIADQAWYLSQTIVYSVYVYFVIGIAVIVLTFIGKLRSDKLAFGMAMSGLMYQAGYLLIGITTEYRYYSWLVMTATLSLAVYSLPRIDDRLASVLQRNGAASH